MVASGRLNQRLRWSNGWSVNSGRMDLGEVGSQRPKESREAAAHTATLANRVTMASRSESSREVTKQNPTRRRCHGTPTETESLLRRRVDDWTAGFDTRSSHRSDNLPIEMQIPDRQFRRLVTLFADQQTLVKLDRLFKANIERDDRFVAKKLAGVGDIGQAIANVTDSSRFEDGLNVGTQ